MLFHCSDYIRNNFCDVKSLKMYLLLQIGKRLCTFSDHGKLLKRPLQTFAFVEKI